jgi:hypothetical protein
VQVAAVPPATPGTTEVPPRWIRLKLEPAPKDAPATGHVLKPGAALDVLTEPWTPPAPGTYVAEGSWQDYTGPAKRDEQKTTAALPTSADPVQGLFVVRGAAFSEYLRFKTN